MLCIASVPLNTPCLPRPALRTAPLLPKPLLVLSHQPCHIDAAADKRPSAVMVHKHVGGNDGLVSRLDRPQAIVVIFEAADAEALIEQADAVDYPRRMSK